MNGEPTLFDPSWPPSVPVDTSEAAADAIQPHQNRLMTVVLDALRSRPQTAQELEQSTGLGGNTIRPRLRELEAAGLVERRDEKRPTPSGRAAYVWFKVGQG